MNIQKPPLRQVEIWYKKQSVVSFVDKEGARYEGKIEKFEKIGNDDALIFIENARSVLYWRNVNIINSLQVVSIFIDASSDSIEKVGLKTGDNIFWVNKQMLGQKCHYFAVMLLGGMKESSEKIVDLSKTFSPNDLQLLLRVLNGDNYFSLTEKEVVQLLDMANFLAQDDMIQPLTECLKYFRKMFFEAVQKRDRRTMRALLEQGHDIQERFGEFALSVSDAVTTNGPGDTPLTYAVRSQDQALVQFLLENGADTAAISRHNTPLMQAAFNQDVDIVKLLLAHKADANLNNGAAMKSVLNGIRDRHIAEQEEPVKKIVHLLFEHGYNGKLEDVVKYRSCEDPKVALFIKIWNNEKELAAQKPKPKLK